MDKTIIYPSPFWFQASGIAASSDGWLVYGATAKSLCVLVPSQVDDAGKISYNAQVVPKAHTEKIVSVSISPEWPVKRAFITGSVDGVAKQWLVEIDNDKVKVKTTHSHEAHKGDREEIVSVGYSTEQYAVTVGADGKIVKWDTTSNIVQSFKNLIRNLRPLCMACSPHIPLHVAVGTKQGVIFLVDLNDNGKLLYKVRGHDEEIMNLGWCPKFEVQVNKHLKESTSTTKSISARLDKIRQEANDSEITNTSVTSETSANETDIVDEEDLFDKYKDHGPDEFGHKKYEPETIAVKVDDDSIKEGDFLAECEKLKNDILNKKTDEEPSIESLVDAMEKTNVNSNGNCDATKKENGHSKGNEEQPTVGTEDDPKSVHIQRHLLASIGKNGTVHIWSKSAKQVSSCQLAYPSKQRPTKVSGNLTLLWYKPDTLLLSDTKCQLVATNPLEIDSKNKMSWRVIHTLHKRVPYCIVSGVARTQEGDVVPRPVWSVSQDRALVQYSLEENKLVSNETTTGGYIYDIVNCPYNADKVAVGAGDGAVRVLSGDAAHSYWNNVQGKVLKVAWHQTRENVLAFGTAEARVGIIEAYGNTERPAKVLQSVLSNGVYGLCWVEDALFACADGALLRYTPYSSEGPIPVPVSLEGASWRVTEVQSSPHGLLVGSQAGGVAVMSPELPCSVIAAAFPATRAIQCIEWHPHQVSSSSEESPYKNWLAVCSLEKNIVVLQLDQTEAGDTTLSIYKSWAAHKGQLCRVAWNPHVEAQLMSTSQDGIVKIWSAAEGICTHILPGHGFGSLGAAWSTNPDLPYVALTGGTDYCLRLWDVRAHPADTFQECDLYANLKKADKKKKAKKEISQEKNVAEETPEDTDEQVATKLESKVNSSKKFLFPTIYKQMTANSLTACRRLLQRRARREAPNGNGVSGHEDDDESGCDFVKMFGSINDVNEVLDMEQREHESRDRWDAWLMVAMLRGHIQAMLDFAVQRSMLTPFILSLAPALSFKSWKDTTQLYISQIERLMAKGQEEPLAHENRRYGGPVVGTAALQLAGADVRGAVKTLTAARLWPAAYLVCRARHVDSLADDVLAGWASAALTEGNLAVAALIYIVMGDLNMAATALGKSHNEEYLSVAADIAKVAGLNTYANHIIHKTDIIKSGKETQATDKDLAELPSRLELLLKENGSGDAKTTGSNGHKADE